MHWNPRKKPTLYISSLVVIGLTMISPVGAQNAESENLDYQRLVHRDSEILADGQTGESINLADGTLSIDQTDVVVRGNSGLDIVVRRSLALSNGGGGVASNRVGFGSMWWRLDLPRIKTVTQSQWITRHPSQPYARCSTNSTDYTTPPDIIIGQPGTPIHYGIHAVSYWAPPALETNEDTNVLLVPLPNVQLPSNGHDIKWVTKGHSAVACLPTIRNGQGEGYLVFTADGKKYWFDWMVKDNFYALFIGFLAHEYSLYATRVEDRYGNWIEYDFEEPPPNYFGTRLVAIRASDGRRVDFTYNSNNLIKTVTAHGRTWTYDYVDVTSGATTRSYLSKVTSPDGSNRSFESSMLHYPYLGNILRCATGTPENVNPQHHFTLKEASGLTTRYELKAQRFGRSDIPACQVNMGGGPVYSYVAFSVSKKTVSGPGIQNSEWLYRYESHFGHRPYVSGFNLTEVRAPDGSLRQFKYGNTFQLNEGLPIEEITLNPTGAVLRSKSYSYELAPNNYGVRIGINPRSRMSGTDPGTDYRAGFEFQDEHLRPPVETTINQNGLIFKHSVESFDALVRPTRVRHSSTPQ